MTRLFFQESSWVQIILGAIAVCFLVDTGNATVIAWSRSGGWEAFWPSLFFALASAALAVIGTWAPLQARRLYMRGALASALIFSILSAVAFVWTQSAGWSAWGVSLSDAAAVREDKSDRRASVRAEIARLEAERGALGVVEPVAGVQARADFECSITSRRYPDGKGPKCTALLEQVAVSERAASIDARLPEMRVALREAPKIATPDADVHIWLMASNAIGAFFGREFTAGDMRMALTIFAVALIGFVANFGLALVHIVYGEDDGAPGGRAEHGHGGDGGGGGRDGIWGNDYALAAAPRLADMRPTYPRLPYAASGLRANEAVPPNGGASGSGVPINITFSGSGFGDGAPASPATYPQPARAERATVPQGRDHLEPQSPAAPDRPVNRAATNELIDHLLTFSAACLLEHSGGVVSGEDMYARYQSWAGTQARSAEVIHALLPEVAGIDQVHYGSALSYRGVAVRERVNLKEAG
jgi:hypothetical protein